jgi:hemin uptake protein HemP
MHSPKIMSAGATVNPADFADAARLAEAAANAGTIQAGPAVRRIPSRTLMQDRREVEIEHGGKIYRLRVTQLNKLILTA